MISLSHKIFWNKRSSLSPTKTIRIAVLTSSRADYGIYRPLLKRLAADKAFDLTILVFGMHLQDQYGLTIKEIEKDAFGKIVQVQGMPENDGAFDIALGYGQIIQAFAGIWQVHSYDLLLVLGDRFEMSAAVQSTIPYGIKLAHIHAGETTLGANDEIYRHQISLASQLFFVSTSAYGEKVAQLKGGNQHIYNFGALSLDEIKDLALPEWSTVCKQFELPDAPFVLITFHPETAGELDHTRANKEILKALSSLSDTFHLVITLPNADHESSEIRKTLEQLKTEQPDRIHLIKSFGKMAYFSAMKDCRFLLGNTSSGIIEAASFGKYVINVGDRQKGRATSENVFHVPYNAKKITQQANQISELPPYKAGNIYEGHQTAERMVTAIKNYLLE